MTRRVRYFAIVGSERTVNNPYNVFREVMTDTSHTLERVDLKNPSRWVDDHSALARYVLQGEPGATEIGENEARQFVESRGGRFAPPDIQG